MIIIDMWHIIEDRWVHLFQERYNDKTVMYVDGKLSGEAAHSNGLISKF